MLPTIVEGEPVKVDKDRAEDFWSSVATAKGAGKIGSTASARSASM